MKNYIILIAALCSFYSCEEEKVEIFVPIFLPGLQTDGKAAAFKNQKKWEASAYGKKEDWSVGTISLIITTYEDKEGLILREMLSFDEIPLKKGSYPLDYTTQEDFNDGEVGAFYGTLEDDGDVAEDFYKLDKTAKDNLLEVTTVDTIAKQISGKFTVSFIKQPSVNPDRPKTLNPDRVKFSNGTFNVKILD
jgi:hypothetical protein